MVQRCLLLSPAVSAVIDDNIKFTTRTVSHHVQRSDVGLVTSVQHENAIPAYLQVANREETIGTI